MTQKHYISVILPLKLEWEPCYWTVEEVVTGDRVRVDFAGKEYVGVVRKTDMVPEIDRKRIKEIKGVEREIGSIYAHEIELWERVAEYYLCSVGEVYKAAYPSVKINMEQARAEAKRKECERKEKTLNSIERRLERLTARLAQKKAQAEKSREGTKIREACLNDIIRLNKDIEKTETLRKAAARTVSADRDCHACTDAWSINDISLEGTIILSQAQEEAESHILEAFEAGKPVLLHGVTGSGKTEIYIRLAQRAMRLEKNVLFLVPEIALSRQLEDRLYEHFGDRLIVFHSGESLAARRNSAETVRHGRYIVLSTRSGLFLPHHDLGLIIVDEEHDASYKQDSPAPRYNGRDTALMMSTLHKGCNIILGSATPSLEEIYNSNAGRHTKVELKEKFHGSETAETEIIDTKAERRKNGMAGNFSRKLIDRIRETLQKGEQVLILRSRRAWSSVLQCSECGEIVKCPHCNVSLCYNKATDSMICHYCGYKERHKGTCSKCGSSLNYLGAGTQKIEEETAALFPEARIARLDSDTAHNRSYETKLIKDFSKGNIDILIGTQIVAKGFDFSGLSLVAIIAADTLLGIQDFRADEKALHLIEQFRGRCGRRGRKGRLVIQTSQPEHPIYMQLNTPDNTTDLQLLAERKDFGFPPYTRTIELTLKDIYEDRLERMSATLAHRLNEVLNEGGTAAHFGELAMQVSAVTPAYRPAVDRIADQHIRKIRICLKKDRQLNQKKSALKTVIAAFEAENKYDGHIIIDVDPS